MTTRAQIDRFFAGHRIGFAGVSTDPKHFSRTIFRELEARGYDVVPIHPTALVIADRTAYHHVYDVPGRLDGVLIMTPRSATAEIVAQCMTAGVTLVWMHHGVGAGAVDHAAASYARSRGIDVIEGECPMMFLPEGEAVHQAHAAIRHAFGHYPDDRLERDRFAPMFAIAYGVIAWSLCTLAMTAFLAVTSLGAALWLHALAAPLIFGGVGWMHAQRRGDMPAVWAAGVFVGVALALDVFVVAVAAGRGFAMFASILGVWLPLALGFLAAAAGGIRQPARIGTPDLPAAAAA
jgi:uncharacterized protein